MTTDKVSVITPCYNGKKFLSETIDAVLLQTYTNWEMIIVDDGSTDGSDELIKAYAEKDPRIIYIRQKNGGSAAARNTGIEAASGRYFTFLDSDDVWHPNFLEKQLMFMGQHNATCVCCAYERINEESEATGHPTPVKDIISVKDMQLTNQIGCLTGVYDSQKFGKQYFNTGYKYRDDYEFWYKIVCLDGKAFGNKEILAKYRVFAASTTGKKLKMVPYQFRIYRETMNFGPVKSFFNLCYWAIAGIIKFR